MDYDKASSFVPTLSSSRFYIRLDLDLWQYAKERKDIE